MTTDALDVETTIADARRRAIRHAYEDGLGELAAGALFGVLGLMFAAEAAAPDGSLMARASAFLLPLLVIGGYFLASRAVRTIKARISYPRAGFATYPRGSNARARRIGALVALCIGALVAFLFTRAPASLDWIPALDGAIVGAFLVFLGIQVGAIRFHALALVSALIGAAATWRGLGESLGSGVYFGAMGIALVASGAVMLARFLRRAPERDAEADA